MKKVNFILATIFAIAIFIVYGYLIYKTWVVFGFWTMVWTGIVTVLSGIILGNLIGSRIESNDKIIYNPKEWPKLLNIIICGSIGYYLYTIISVPNIDQSNYYFGLCYLILLSALPIVWAVYRLLRDRNDFVEIDEKFISYKDNKKSEKFEISKISKIEGAITIHFNDQTTHDIDLKNMNFNSVDRISLTKDIQSRIPKIENNDIDDTN
jgi:hypothetical protein